MQVENANRKDILPVMKKLKKGVILFILMFSLLACKESAESKQDRNQAEWEMAGMINGETDNVCGLNGGILLDGLSVKGEDSLYYCNLEENMRSDDSGGYSVLVCKDSVYDVTYYVNYGRDYYIYAMREGVSELAVKIPGRELFCRNGELYFIADTYGLYEFETFAEGNILKYNPVDGCVETVVEEAATTMIVYPDGICFNDVGEPIEFGEDGEMRSTPVDYFYYSFEEKRVIPFSEKGMEMRRWNNNWIVTKIETLSESSPTVQQLRDLGYLGEVTAATGTDMKDMEGNVISTLKDITSLPATYWMKEELLYYIEQKAVEGSDQRRSVLMTYDLNTGTKEEVVTLDFPTVLSNSDMLLFHDTLYFGNLLRVSLQEGTQCYAQYADESIDFGNIDAFYTDGDTMFCLKNNVLWRMEEKKSMAIGTREFVTGVPLEIGTYEYYLYPLGQ